MRHGRPLAALAALLAPALVAGCDAGDAREAPHDAPIRTALLLDLAQPESARYDSTQDAFFVSNIDGYGSDRDAHGYILRVPADTPHAARVFVQSGDPGVRLDAPFGLAIHGDTLWTADIDVLRGFDRHDGRPLATVDLRPQHAQRLNDVAIGPDDRIYVTDTGIWMSDKGVKYVGGDRIFAIGPNRSVTVVDSGPSLGRPNGLTWDARGKRWLVLSFDPFVGRLFSMRQGDTTKTVLARGKGQWDGVEALADGRIVYTCWKDSSVHVLSPSGEDHQIVRGIPTPADIGIDTRRGRVAIPSTNLGRLEIWTLPSAPRR
jgi:sugar lactone lactonase YvrE